MLEKQIYIKIHIKLLIGGSTMGIIIKNGTIVTSVNEYNAIFLSKEKKLLQ